MKLPFLIAASSIALVNAVAIEPRAVICSEILVQMNIDISSATNFCRVYMQLSPKTKVSTFSDIRTVTSNVANYITSTRTFTPAESTKIIRTTAKSTTRVTPAVKTTTQTQTSTAYLDANGGTITMLRRNSVPSAVDLAARAIATPAYLKGLSKGDIRAACNCLQLTAPTYTRGVTVRATEAVLKTLDRNIVKSTTIQANTRTTTSTRTLGVTVTAPAPRFTDVTWVVETQNGCPPGTDTTWVCPDQTREDDGSDPNFQNCAVLSQDGYSGYCLYWSDDGSPAASTLIFGDGSGEADSDLTRDAVYGDNLDDDCPSWANWLCTASPGTGQRRSIIEVASNEHELQKRGRVPKAISPSQHRKNGKAKMPKGLRRGGKFVGKRGNKPAKQV